MHAVAGADLFLYDKGANSAYLFLKKRLRRSHMLVGVINGLMFVLSYLLTCSGGVLERRRRLGKVAELQAALEEGAGLNETKSKTLTKMGDRHG